MGAAQVRPALETVTLHKSAAECRSPMCGTVVRVNIQPGAVVDVDDVLLVLEAMKMETNIKAPAAGRIKTVNVQPGDAVLTDQLLVEFE